MLRIQGMTLVHLIQSAYGLENASQIEGGPMG